MIIAQWMRCLNEHDHCASRGKARSHRSDKPSVEDWWIMFRFLPFFMYLDDYISSVAFYDLLWPFYGSDQHSTTQFGMVCLVLGGNSFIPKDIGWKCIKWLSHFLQSCYKFGTINIINYILTNFNILIYIVLLFIFIPFLKKLKSTRILSFSQDLHLTNLHLICKTSW